MWFWSVRSRGLQNRFTTFCEVTAAAPVPSRSRSLYLALQSAGLGFIYLHFLSAVTPPRLVLHRINHQDDEDDESDGSSRHAGDQDQVPSCAGDGQGCGSLADPVPGDAGDLHLPLFDGQCDGFLLSGLGFGTIGKG